jgi:ATP-dependent helicase/nuclease subunit A
MRSAAPSDEFVIPEKTILDQRRAADPRASAWVSANAGAGKTKVLVDRVLRLLLAGSPPGRILCLTFTKAGAAEMALRVFDRLGQWVTLDEPELEREIARLEGVRPRPEQIRLARRLFARSVETPGGLKIETIHAFCERILHLVPFEANVPARFSVLDENQVADLTAEATESVLADAAAGVPHLRRALDIVGVEATGDALAWATGAAVKAVADSQRGGGPAALIRALSNELGLGPGETSAAVERAMLDGGFSPARCRELAGILAGGKGNDQERAAALRAAAGAVAPDSRLKHYLCAFFNKKQEPYAAKTIVTKVMDGLRDEFLAEQSRLVPLLDRRRAAQAVERTAALFTLAGEIHARVERTKAARGALDFQDLIVKTLAVLSRGGSEWILYKLDRGIDHVLVDEAQDTNPDQWDILRRITEDFTAGAGARGQQIRTLFAVGDPKQSIFGFQGAAPREFEVNRRHWESKVGRATLDFHDVRLELSFRSGEAILSAVDATFAIETHFRGLSYEANLRGTAHTSARPRAPGLVELWPTETAAEEDEPEAWTQPLDTQGQESSPPVAVAARIARAVKLWTTQGDERGRRWRASDVLILVRKRGPAFEAVIRALRQAEVPVAGADRIEIGEHIAVLDLVAAGRAALLPDDDLTLAVALKSPLVGLDDDDLVRIAARRPEGEIVAAALARHAAAGDAAAERGAAALAQWRALARRHGPFGFYATLLGPMDGRARLVARLGSEAGDAIDAFLSVAHGAERTETPSLITFLARFESASHPIKRDLDAKRDEVRVMTVHGAKGLEAPIVIVIDGCEVSGQHPMRDPPLIPIELPGGGTTLVWSCAKADDCARVAAAREAMHAKDLEEHNRLLYVAMTRARDRLVIAPYTGRKEAPEAAWCEMVRRGLTARVGGIALTQAPYGPTALWTNGEAAAEPAVFSSLRGLEAIEAPEWLTAPVESEGTARAQIRPSGALGQDAAPADQAAQAARLAGTLTHTLLQRLPGLPPGERGAAARAFVAAGAPSLDPATRDRVVAEVMGLLEAPALQPLFGPGSRAEVGVSGPVRVGSRSVPVSGQIDRVAVLPTEVLIADYKTGHSPRPGGAAPEAYVRQLALYAALVREIYPDRPVRALLIWTRDGRIETFSTAALEACLARLKAA